MSRRKHAKEGGHVRALALLAVISQLVWLVLVAARKVGRLLSRKHHVDAAGLSARDRFDLYADLEYARERERLEQARRNLAPRGVS
jgi:hypothetical protein